MININIATTDGGDISINVMQEGDDVENPTTPVAAIADVMLRAAGQMLQETAVAYQAAVADVSKDN